jgi:hypothetical protein
MIEKLIQKSHGAGIGGVSSLVHKLVKLNPIKQTRNELKLGVVKFAQPITNNVLQLPEGGDFGALHCQPSTNFDRSTKLDLTTEPPLLGRCCYK